MKTCLQDENKNTCNCTYPVQEKVYVANVSNIISKVVNAACYFNKEFEKTYNRSLSNYLQMLGGK